MKITKNGKTLINCNEYVSESKAIQRNISILSRIPSGSTIEETTIVRNYYNENVGDELVHHWQLKTNHTWERI